MSEILEKYNFSKNLLGHPLDDEHHCPDSTGRYQHFEKGSVHWYPGVGAHETHGAIRSQWADLGWESSFLGYPISDEIDISEWNLDNLTNKAHAAARDSGILVQQPTEQKKLAGPVLFAEHQLGIDSSFARISYFQHGAIAFVWATAKTIVFQSREPRLRYMTAFTKYILPQRSITQKIASIFKGKG